MIKADLQIHTIFSFDSLSKPEDIIKMARKKKIGILGITDHDEIDGALQIKKLAKGNPYIVVGQEIHTNKGEIIGLFLNKKIVSHIFDKAVNEIKKQNGLVVLPHPSKRKISLSNEQIEKCVDLIEVYSSRSFDIQNKNSSLFAKDFKNKGLISGSDAHFVFEIGTSYMCLKKIKLNDKNIKNILKTFNGNIHKKRNLLFVESFSQFVAFLKCLDTKYLLNSILIFFYSIFRELTPPFFQKVIYFLKDVSKNKTNKTELVNWYDMQANFESVKKSYLSKEAGKKYFYQRRFKEVVSMLPKKNVDSILEIGCGVGYYASYLSRKSKNVSSLDVSNEYIRRAKEYVLQTGNINNVNFSNISDFNLRDNKNKYEVLLCTEVLEHLENPYKTLDSYLNCIKAGGSVILSFPSKYSVDELFMKMYGLFAFNEHISTIDPFVVDKIMEEKGFIRDRISHIGFGYFYFNKLLTIFPYMIKLFEKIENFIIGRKIINRLCWTLVISYKKQ